MVLMDDEMIIKEHHFDFWDKHLAMAWVWLHVVAMSSFSKALIVITSIFCCLEDPMVSWDKLEACFQQWWQVNVGAQLGWEVCKATFCAMMLVGQHTMTKCVHVCQGISLNFELIHWS